jgi:hypothetical protein
MAQRMLTPEQASGWHQDKAVAIDRLLLELDRGTDPAEVWSRYIDLDEEMAKRFPQGSWF